MVPDLVKMTWPEYGTLWKSPSELISSSIMRHSPTRCPRRPPASLGWANGRVARKRVSVRARIAPSERNVSFVVMVVGTFHRQKRGASWTCQEACTRRVGATGATRAGVIAEGIAFKACDAFDELPTRGNPDRRPRGRAALWGERLTLFAGSARQRQQRLRRPAPAAGAGLPGSRTGRRRYLSRAVETWGGCGIAVLRTAIA